LHDQPIDLAGVHLGTPGPPYANVVGPRLVAKCTPVPHPRVVALTSFPTCPGFVKDNVYIPPLPKTLPEL